MEKNINFAASQLNWEIEEQQLKKFMSNMSDLHLHIVSFDVPYPANYGGVIDVFYKAKALAAKGVKVHLHCFQYGRKPSMVLENLFFEVNYYRRDISKNTFSKAFLTSLVQGLQGSWLPSLKKTTTLS